MKKTALIFSVLLLTLTMNAQQSLAGVWDTGKENTKIEISEQEGVYFGQVVASDNDKVKPGTALLKDVKLVDGEWKGKLYALRKGKWLDAVLEENRDLLLISVKAGMMKKKLEWTRE